MRGVTSNVAASEIRHSCRERFPGKSDATRDPQELGASEVAAITGQAGVDQFRNFSGRLYNGNKDITITQVRINVTIKDEGKFVSRIYAEDLTISPH